MKAVRFAFFVQCAAACFAWLTYAFTRNHAALIAAALLQAAVILLGAFAVWPRGRSR